MQDIYTSCYGYTRQIPLSTALEEIVGTGYAAIISCISGQLGYYEGEEQNERYLLQVQ
jgi:hypothetical protein